MYQKGNKKPANCFQLRVEKTLVEVFVLKHGAEGRSRTGTGCPTRPSSVRVYQFHHFGTHFYIFYSATFSSLVSSATGSITISSFAIGAATSTAGWLTLTPLMTEDLLV